jgi:sortase A
MRKTAYFSLVLMLAAVVLAARFGARPEPRALNQPTIAAVATVITTPTSVLPVAGLPTVASTATPLPTALRVALTSVPLRTAGQTSDESVRPAATPSVLSPSGAYWQKTLAETPERHKRGSRAVGLAPATVTPAPTDAPRAARPRPTAQPPTATRDSSVDSGGSAPALPPERIVAPTIGLDSKIVPVGWHEVTYEDGSQGTEWDVASFAVSWNKTSAKLGEAGNSVLTGHNNIEGEVFRHLEHLNLGDPITLYADGRARQYKVTEKFILQEKDVPYTQRLENGKWIGRFPDERITLMSCWPYTGDSHRIFIIARPAAQG